MLGISKHTVYNGKCIFNSEIVHYFILGEAEMFVI